MNLLIPAAVAAAIAICPVSCSGSPQQTTEQGYYWHDGSYVQPINPHLVQVIYAGNPNTPGFPPNPPTPPFVNPPIDNLPPGLGGPPVVIHPPGPPSPPPPSVTPVPEPATWALMIMGFGLAGAALRTKSRLTA